MQHPKPSDPDAAVASARVKRPAQSDGPTVSFAIGKLRVRLALAFLIVAAVPGIAGGLGPMLLFAALLLSVVVVHELGHALLALAFERRATIAVRVWGGSTQIDPPLAGAPGIAAALAGPAASLVVALVFWKASTLCVAPAWLRLAAYGHAGWGAINLLPFVPFDAGRLFVGSIAARRRATVLAASGAIAGTIAVEGLFVRSALLFLVFGLAACASWKYCLSLRRLEQEKQQGLHEAISRGRLLLSEGDAVGARSLAERVASRARCRSTENAAWELFAWAELALDQPKNAEAALAQIRPRHAADSHCRAAILVSGQEPVWAIRVLETARNFGELTPEALRLLIDLYAVDGAFDRACVVADSSLDLLGVHDARSVVEAALAAGADATLLTRRIFVETHDPDDAIAYACALARSGDRSKACRVLTSLAPDLVASELRPATLLHLGELAAQPALSAMIGPALLRMAHAAAK